MRGADINDILTFIAVVDAGGFSAGSRSIGLSRSAGGKAIARLEAKFGQRLLNRNTRALALTERGQELYARSQEIVAAMSRLETDLVLDMAKPRGVLKITAPDALCVQVVLPVIGAYLEKWPDVRVELSLSDAPEPIVERGFDLSIRIGVTSPNPGLMMRLLHRAEVVLCAAPEYIARQREPTDVEQLEMLDLLFHARHNERQHWRLRDRTGAKFVVRGRSRLRLDSGAAIRSATLSGLGVALLPRLLVASDFERGDLRQLLPETSIDTVPIVALYPANRHVEGKVRHFIDALVEAFSVRPDG